MARTGTVDLPPSSTATHAVENQPPLLEDWNPFQLDLALGEALEREAGGWGRERVRALGAEVGSARVVKLARDANRFVPELRTHDRFGHRIDEVEFHPAWHDLMRLGFGAGAHALPWREPRPGAHVVRAALAFLLNQGENGICCPVAMTFAAVPVLRHAPDLARLWQPRAIALDYDPRFVPAERKTGAVIGMAMTEKQGGSDVRANSSRADHVSGREYRLTGHKWFCSAPMSDAFFTLAQAPGGLSCFFVPRFAPDGTRNRFLLQRLKDKLGNRSNASSEVEYRDTFALLVGEEGEGVKTIIPMVHHTRLDAALSSSAFMRFGLAQAAHHATHRMAFGRRLADHPLMRNVLADLALESEAATVLVMRLARAFDDAAQDAGREAFTRLATAIVKFWVCKRAPAVVLESLECLGGNGYVEEGPMARLYRDAPLNSIWEGAGNVISLDALRTMARAPDAMEALRAELMLAKGADRRLDAWLDGLGGSLAEATADESQARTLVERLALAWQAGLVVRHSPAAVADAFLATRIGGEGGRGVGTLPKSADVAAILTRAWPAAD
jgi:putative acyl-CoA dehydrogenase